MNDTSYDTAEERSALKRGPLPRHVGIIMDGNGRWARARGLERIEGHREGAKALRRVIEESINVGIPYLSAFAFSTENWHRPREEVEGLMTLMAEFSVSEAGELAREGVRVIPVGDVSTLPTTTREKLKELESRTSRGETMTLLMAINYGGRAEIIRAARELASRAQRDELDPGEIDDGVLRSHLYTHPYPDPDLIIRTGGEWRLSNFLLYQAAYSEFFSTDVKWPDFDARALHSALREFQRRERRFGGLQDAEATRSGGGGR